MTDILQHPHPLLRAVCAAVTEFGAPVRALADKLWDALQANDGLGLAANQIGVCIRLVVIADGPQRLTLVNPRLIYARGQQRLEEGCLSVQNGSRFVTRVRPAEVLIEFVDCDGVPCRRRARGQLAAVIAHELDHLEGRLFIDVARAVA